MAFRVLIVEDKPDLRGLLYEHLHEAFSRNVQHGWPEGWPKHADKHLEIDVVSEEGLRSLLSAKRKQTVKRRFEALTEPPDVIITDLALSTSEVTKLDKKGGTEPSGAKNPLDQLEQTTGFQILQAMAPSVPVIATTYASNPLILEACWREGAHAVIPKPATDDQMSAYYALWKHIRNPHMGLNKSQKSRGERWGRRIETYLKSATHEVLKAVRARALAQMESVVPRQLPYWLALDRDRLDGRRIEGTSLMLIDIEGFSPLAELGKAKPKALFKMINKMWDQVHPLLEDSGAEINHFAGDAALIFRGVYDDSENPCQLGETLQCGVDASRLFGLRGPVQTTLIEVITESYETAPRRTVEQMVRLVESPDFDVRVISIEPPEDEALYGKVGASSRWQHSTLSRYFNLLKAAKDELDRSQREKGLARQGAESFLIYDRREKPQIPGFTIESLEELLKARPRFLHGELASFEIHRIFEAPDRETVQ